MKVSFKDRDPADLNDEELDALRSLVEEEQKYEEGRLESMNIESGNLEGGIVRFTVTTRHEGSDEVTSPEQQSAEN